MWQWLTTLNKIVFKIVIFFLIQVLIIQSKCAWSCVICEVHVVTLAVVTLMPCAAMQLNTFPQSLEGSFTFGADVLREFYFIGFSAR